MMSATIVWASVPTAEVVCTDTGFALTVNKLPEVGKTQVMDIEIGSGSGDSDCTFTGGAVNNTVGNTVGISVTQQNISSTTELPYTQSGVKCGGTFANNVQSDATHIEYENNVTVTVRQIWNTGGRAISREDKYKMVLLCRLTKFSNVSVNGSSWAVERTSITPTVVEGANDTFNFVYGFTHAHMDSGTYKSTYTIGDWIQLDVKTIVSTPAFKTIVQKCWFTASSNKDDPTRDVWLDNRCPVGDKNFEDIRAASDSLTSLKVRAFFFTDAPSSSIFAHCLVATCLDADSSPECTFCQNARRRRNALLQPKMEESKSAGIQQRVVSLEQPILIDSNEVVVVRCGRNMVYDRIAKECSSENILQISGLYLDIPWVEDYANTSSKAFKDFAIGIGYKLYALTQMVDESDAIVGLDIVGAKKGSVILTVIIKYATTSSASSSFLVFKRAMRQSENHRANKVLHIRNDKVIEYINLNQPLAPDGGLSMEHLSVIIVAVVVLCVAVLLSLVAVFKIRHNRRGAAGNTGVEIKGENNPNYY